MARVTIGVGAWLTFCALWVVVAVHPWAWIALAIIFVLGILVVAYVARRRAPSRMGWVRIIAMLVGPLVIISLIDHLQNLAENSGTNWNDIRISATVLPDESEFHVDTNYVMPYGLTLPSSGNVYCGQPLEAELRRLGKPVGSAMQIRFQNTYTGQHAQDILVSRIWVDVLESQPAAAGVIVRCLNSGGDEAILSTVRAAPSSPAYSTAQRTSWRASDPFTGGKTTSFTLTGAESQEVDLSVLPDAFDRLIDVKVDLYLAGKLKTISILESPVWIHTDAAASPILAVLNNGPMSDDYECGFDIGKPIDGICKNNTLFTKTIEDRILATRPSAADSSTR